MSEPVSVRRAVTQAQPVLLGDIADGASRGAPRRYPSVAQIREMQRQAEAQGQRDGYRAGFAEGQAHGRAAAERETARLCALLEQMADAMSALDEEVLRALGTLAVAMARAVVGVAVRERPDQLLAVAKQAVAMMGERREATRVYVHPEELALLKPWADDAKLALIPDSAVEPGGCIVEAGYSRVDATLGARLEKMAEELLAALPPGTLPGAPAAAAETTRDGPL